jgi:hypothetical protein
MQLNDDVRTWETTIEHTDAKWRHDKTLATHILYALRKTKLQGRVDSQANMMTYSLGSNDVGDGRVRSSPSKPRKEVEASRSAMTPHMFLIINFISL